ncbi:MAG: tyrosine-protein phosphatase [Chloroflexi bacterium]|nr:tyrosine-protein phosphatase [Chloroflexota bacterium]
MKDVLELNSLPASVYVTQARSLPFRGAKNFRDLGGYETVEGRTVRWNVLYRSDALHKLTDSDLKFITALKLTRIIDFRAPYETAKEPDRLPDDLVVRLLKLPMEDASTKVWHEARNEMVRNMKTLDPGAYMRQTNVELATIFTPEYRLFFRELLASGGNPVLFHCAAGKDRTGFAAACILRILGVTMDVVIQDYLLTNHYLLEAYPWEMFLAGVLRGKKFVDGVRGFMRADESYLMAAFDALEKEHGSFANYVRDGLRLGEQDIAKLKLYYLE